MTPSVVGTCGLGMTGTVSISQAHKRQWSRDNRVAIATIGLEYATMQQRKRASRSLAVCTRSIAGIVINKCLAKPTAVSSFVVK
jgi:hypothetical protein